MAFKADKAVGRKIGTDEEKKISAADIEITRDSSDVTVVDGDKTPVVDVRGLCKEFKNVKALDNVSFTVEEGDAFGFIGPNGAGKTTTIRILATLLEPTSGEVYIDGIPVLDDPESVREAIGYMPDYFGVYDGMKVWEYMDFFASAYHTKSSERKTLISDVLEITDLTGKRDTFIETLSKGMKQRLCLAKTLLNDPRVLILDEPAAGLDPRARIELKELLRELTRMKKTIFISSHILPELSDLCNKIGIIEAGKLLACGSMGDFTENLWDTSALRTVKIRALEGDEKVLKALEAYNKVHHARRDNSGFIVEFGGGLEDLNHFLEYLVAEKLKVIEFAEKGTDLEDVFMKITRGEVV